MLTMHHIYAVLVLSGRFSLAEAEKAAKLFSDSDDDILDKTFTVRDAVSEIVGAAGMATGKMRVNCPRCDGRGFYRGYKMSENEAAVLFCDDCEGNGTVLAELD